MRDERMCAAWKNQHNMEVLLRKINAPRKQHSSGTFVFHGLEYFEAVAALMSNLQMDRQIPAIDREGLVRAAMRVAAQRGEISAQAALRAISNSEAQYLKKPLTTFHLCTSLSMQALPTLRTRKLSETLFAFSTHRPRHYDIGPLERKIEHHCGNLRPFREYMAVRVIVRDRTALAGASKALDCLDLLRAFWNFYWNLRHPYRMSSDPHPVNSILRGPFHTIHTDDGMLATEEFYYEQYKTKPPVPERRVATEWPKFHKFETDLRRRLRQIPYRDQLERSLRFYVRALDQSDYDQAFVGLWTTLELLTDTPMARYDVTVKRAAFVWEAHDYHQSVLSYLRQLRNITVHSDEFGQDGESSVYQLKQYVEQLFKFHLFNRFRFGSIAEACALLDMPAGREELKGRVRLAQNALRYRSR